MPGPRAERGRWRRKTQRTHKADPKRRKKSGKSEKESVSNSLIDYVKWIFFFSPDLVFILDGEAVATRT